MSRRKKPAADRFWPKVNKQGETRVAELGECWEWTGAISKKGYANFRINGQTVGAHTFSFRIHCGEYPPEMQINHLCNFRSCVRPTHLYAGTQDQNLADREIFGTTPRGLKHRNTKLSGEQIKEIFNDHRTPTKLAPINGVSISLVSLIQTGKHRKSETA